MPFRFNLTGKKKWKKGLDFFDVSYRFHNASTNTLIIYNNSRSRKCNVAVSVKDSNNLVFSIVYEEILASTALMVLLSDLTVESGKSFLFPVKEVVFSYADQVTKFIPEENKFVRVK